MTTAIEVRPIEVTEIGACTAVLVRSFWDYPETVHLLPGERSRRRVLPRYTATDLRDALAHGGCHVAGRDGTIIGVALWLPPTGYPIGVRREVAQAARLVPILPWATGAVRRGRAGQSANHDHHRGLPEHYWLRVLGVDPAAQSTGVGSALVEHLIGRVDGAGVGCFLFTAAEPNVAWYTRFGFAVRDHYRPTPDWPWVWTMWRDPVLA